MTAAAQQRPYPVPDNEAERLERLERYQILDTPAEEAFDRATRLASKIMDTPIALVSLVDRDRQWFKSRLGLDVPETPRDIAFCTHAIMTTDPLVVGDALNDKRFADNPLVLEQPKIRFYAGAPLTTRDGFNMGTLCAIDMVPHEPTADQIEALQDLAQMVVDELDLRAAGRLALEDVARRKQLDDLKSTFITEVNHELRTPLTSILGSLKILTSEAFGDLPEEVIEMLVIANRNGDQLLALVNDLLDMAKLDAGAMEFDFETLDVVGLVADVVENMSTFAREKNLTVEVTSTTPAMALLADRKGLVQVMTNLISNAVKFSPSDARVDVRVSTQAGSVRIDVKDYGVGIPDHQQQKIFEKFMQVRKAAAVGVAGQGPKGTGLGLSICKSIVEAHGGTISFESKENESTTFTVDLPIHVPTEAVS